MKIYLRKIDHAYIVDSGDDSNIKNGEIVSAEIKRPRNYKFHKKYFALINYAYSIWTPEEKQFNGIAAEKSLDRFRKDIMILAGYYEIVINVKNDVRFIAKSISFGSMEEDDFEKLYSKTIDVLLKHVFDNYTRKDVDEVVMNLIGFD